MNVLFVFVISRFIMLAIILAAFVGLMVSSECLLAGASSSDNVCY